MTAGQAPVSPPLISQVWGMATPAHAIQRATAFIGFAEPATTLTVRRIIDALRPIAREQGLPKEEPISSIMFELKPGAKPKAFNDEKTGTAFQAVSGEIVSEAFHVTSEGLRYESSAYTRWIAFREKLRTLLAPCLPIVAGAVPIGQVSAEYTDFFYSKLEGNADASLILDRKSGVFSSRAFSKRDPFHSHNGWFENISEQSRYLVNVDVGVADALGPPGIRRAITIRTNETEQIQDPFGARATSLANLPEALQSLDVLHNRLKNRLADVLTREARSMISLGR